MTIISKITKNQSAPVFLFVCFLTFSCFMFAAGEDSLYNQILHKYVDQNGLVDYKNLKNDERLDEYINYLSGIKPDSLNSRDSKLAFWINVYNTFTLKLICESYPIESIKDLNWTGTGLDYLVGKTAWDKKFINIDNKIFTLNQIEHDIIRKEFRDPRIHFALVCAALSCPNLRNEVYTPDKLNNQLDNQAIKFLNNSKKNKFDLDSKTAYLSKIFDWYGGDFGEPDDKILTFISKYLRKEIADSILDNIAQWKIEFLDYNWKLNEQGNSL